MRMMTLALTAGLLAVGAALADDKAVKLSGENTKVEFVGSKKEGSHKGGFKKLTGTATVGEDVTKSKIEVEIDTTSLYSDDEKLTKHLLSADFFDAKKYPTAKFVSTKVEKGEKGVIITGDLTMLGKTKSVSFPAELTAKDGAVKLNGKFAINRSEHGIVFGKGKIDEEVKLSVSVDAK